MFHFFHQLFAYYGNGTNWTGNSTSSGFLSELWSTLDISVESVLIAMAVAMPVALVLGHTGRGGYLAVNISGVGRALPAIAVLVIGVQLFGIGTPPALATLIVLSLPPVMTNTYAGIRNVDPEIIDAARGMGMTGWQILWRVEVPTALPLISAGIRTAAVQAVATVTLAAEVSYTCLGTSILEGISVGDHVEIVAAALLVVALALLVEVTLAGLQRLVTPAGLRTTARLALVSAP